MIPATTTTTTTSQEDFEPKVLHLATDLWRDDLIQVGFIKAL